MEIKYFTLLLATYSSAIFAQTLPPDRTSFTDKNLFIQPDLLIKPLEKDALLIPDLSDQSYLEDQINHAIINKNWQSLEILLKDYKTTKNYDPILYDYGLGALYRYKGEQDKAIEVYKKIINTKPELHYPRFDLAMMLFEDQRFNAAEKEFNIVYPFMSPQIQTLINQLLIKIKKEQAWSPIFNLSFKNTNNVNQASETKEVVINEAIFVRDEDSLPQKAQGFGYELAAIREKNIVNNHYVNLGLNFNGVHYWNNTEYSEQTIRTHLGYKYKDIKQSLGFIPFIEQNLLGNRRYSHHYGAGLIYNRKLLDSLQISSNINHIKKSYEDDYLAQNYNGFTNSQSLIFIYQSSLNWLVYGGPDFINDKLNDKSESSKSKGIRTGFLYFGNFLSIDTNLRYGKRKFSADNIWYGEKRVDNEYQFNISIWNKYWNWKGFTPKLNYSYQNIDSNLALYKRDNGIFFINIDRQF